MSYNRIHNSSNKNQGTFKRVLCVCSAGLLRSPTAAFVLSQEPYNYNTRAVGIVGDYALLPVEDVNLIWADEIVCMDKGQESTLRLLLTQYAAEYDMPELLDKQIIVLNIPDKYPYRHPELIEMIKKNYNDFKLNEKAE